MIRRLLIANRGEIALRIIRACREMGVETVAGFSEADRGAPHACAADAAVCLGPARSADSYLNAAAIVAAAQNTGADAVHPGYGFLAENAPFAAACEAAGIVFVGPPSSVISQMGSKVASRRLMQQAGVPVVPGETPIDQTGDGLRAAIARTGLPALVKASAGGGGKGMRLVHSESEMDEAIASARREAESAFGDGTLYVERLLQRPRHVEVQIFADAQGRVVHLFERDCSVQRRHQKVIEESPSPLVESSGPRLRARLTEAAVRAAQAVSYRNAGTVEFLVEGRGEDATFFFLEMNTRLQVEHPVTELVTGVDLVRAQILVASGEPLPWIQTDLTQRGHAIEARVYAEDPARDFLPQAGPLLLYREPTLPGVRVDAGVREGDEVSVHYDPLIAKVIAAAESRDLAIARLRAALRQFPVLGVQTNIPFLLVVLDQPEFIAGSADTAWLDRGIRFGSSAAPPHVLAAIHDHDEGATDDARGPGHVSGRGRDPWVSLQGWRR